METALDLQNLTYAETIIRLLISGVVGAAIGYERESSRRPAGFRTNMLVAVGACLMMILSIQIGLQYEGSDPSRVAAQVVSGIGFLGAGTIITKGGRCQRSYHSSNLMGECGHRDDNRCRPLLCWDYYGYYCLVSPCFSGSLERG